MPLYTCMPINTADSSVRVTKEGHAWSMGSIVYSCEKDEGCFPDGDNAEAVR